MARWIPCPIFRGNQTYPAALPIHHPFQTNTISTITNNQFRLRNDNCSVAKSTIGTAPTYALIFQWRCNAKNGRTGIAAYHTNPHEEGSKPAICKSTPVPANRVSQNESIFPFHLNYATPLPQDKSHPSHYHATYQLLSSPTKLHQIQLQQPSQ